MKHSRLRLTFVVAGALLLASMPSGRAGAADAVGDFFYTARQIVSEAWEAMIAPITNRTVDAVTPPSPMRLIHGMASKSGSEFWDHLSDAGYDLAEIETSVGIIPDVKMTFQLMRELSEADRDPLQPNPNTDHTHDPTLVPLIHPPIVRTH